ncbi:winged helix-turn-helix transcriptional regulator [Ruegeria arenilitoris]|uniref:winged helix-turn-helix transcriptional regulator n=1 Tax=Ruegeria arenilitoris TaxID=1173585 RepID=UPI00147A1EAB|nr:helix-turn-helix domain-containing protein [Ruegeria arenilitoris]
MTKYGQFCPIAKSSEILGDTWSILIVRELLLGSTRFSQLQKGLPKISPTILTKRLKELETSGVILKRKLSAQRGHEYRLTPAGRELSGVIEALAVWGMRWARDEMEPDDLDATFLMFDIERNIVTNELPDGENVICFQFSDLDDFSKWWVICDGNNTDLCYQDPGKDVTAYITANSVDLIKVWMGDLPLSAALRDDKITLLGEPLICDRLRKWFPLSSAASVPRPSESERTAI